MNYNHIVIFGGESDLARPIVDLLGKQDIVCYCLPHSEADVRDFNSLNRAIRYYKPDAVINLAGISNLQPILNSNRAKWYDEIETNLIGSYNVAHAAAYKNLTMIFMGSVAGKYGKPNHSGYSASKAGVISLVQSLGMEGYNAYCISPGRIDTKMREKDFPGERKETRLEPAEIALIVRDILAGEYEPGDNIIIRRIGDKTQDIIVDDGRPWKEQLQVGKPPIV
jgi:NAD(P)-dependent dehydrogenase (short-subunit alcohol dehydrogenase family)